MFGRVQSSKVRHLKVYKQSHFYEVLLLTWNYGCRNEIKIRFKCKINNNIKIICHFAQGSQL